MFSESAGGTMPEILTESFCERCGTRYTFESAAPQQQKRLGKIKVLSKGLKNFVLDDDVALDEALAQARTDEERVTTTQQLDAFHDTFNFCMSCRQYTCSNCWNETEGRCQTCSPLVGGDFIDEQARGSAKARNGKGPKRPAKPSVEDLAWPTTDLRRFDTGKETTGAAPKSKPETQERAAATAAPGAPKTAPTQPKRDKAAAAASGVVAPEAWPELPSLAERLKKVAAPAPKAADEAPVEWPSVDTVLDRPAAASPAAPGAPARPAPGSPKAGGRGVPSEFQPGQSIDAALEAYESQRRRDVADVEAELARGKAAREAARETAARETAAREAAAREAAAREAAAREEAARQAAAREAAAREEAARQAAAREAAAREAAANEAAQQEAAELEAAAREALARQAEAREASQRDAAARRAAVPPSAGRSSVRGGRTPRSDDRVELPTWRVVTPETPPLPSVQPPPPPAAASYQPPQADESPRWPNEPAVDTLAFLANRSAEARGMDEVWAASTRDLLSVSTDAAAPGGVQECVSCGLSLSATARFCRRCGTRQG